MHKMSKNTAQAGLDTVVRSSPQEGTSHYERLLMLAAVVDSDPDLIYFRDMEGVCRMANTSLARAFGISTNRIIGRSVAGIFPQETACSIMEQEEAALAHEAQQISARTIKLPQGEIPYVVTHEVFYDSDGQVAGVFGRLRDISEHKRLEREVVETSEREMRRIAMDLHDDLCQELAAVSLISKLLQKRLAEDGPTHEKIAAHIADLTKRLAVSTRNLVQNLAPPVISGENFIENLRRVAGHLCAAFPLQCGIEGSWPNQITDRTIPNHLYRIAHEAMHNAAKHSGGNYITVRLRTTQDAFTVYIVDNGIGFRPESNGLQGIGLSTMRYRAGLIGGTLKIESTPGRGTTVACRVGLKN